MDVLTEVLHAISGSPVWDVHLPGYLDHESGTPRATPMSATAYLELENGFLRLAAVGNQGGLELSLAPGALAPADLDQDDEFVLISIGGLLFDVGGGPPEIARIRYAMNGESDAARGIVRCAEFQLARQAALFFDPGWIPGIRLSTAGGYEAWQRDAREHEREIFGFVTEHVWEPPSGS
jgi:hypothetical protein